jgi:hypothetical protein
VHKHRPILLVILLVIERVEVVKLTTEFPGSGTKIPFNFLKEYYLFKQTLCWIVADIIPSIPGSQGCICIIICFSNLRFSHCKRCPFYRRCRQHWSSYCFISYPILFAICESVHNRRVSIPSWAAEHRKSANKYENHTSTYVVHQTTLFYMVSHIRRIILSA